MNNAKLLLFSDNLAHEIFQVFRAPVNFLFLYSSTASFARRFFFRFLLSISLSLFASPSFLFSLFLSVCTASPLRHSFSLLSRSIARRGRGDAATPCPFIPLRLAISGGLNLDQNILWSHCRRERETAVTVARRLQLARHRRYSLILLIISTTHKHAMTPLCRSSWRFRTSLLFYQCKGYCTTPETFIVSGSFAFLLRLNLTTVSFLTMNLEFVLVLCDQGSILCEYKQPDDCFFLYRSSSLIRQASIVFKSCRYFLFYICMNFKFLLTLTRLIDRVLAAGNTI